MKLLRTNTACRITVGPFFDKTDGVTPETSLTVTSCKLTFLVDAANVPTLVIDANATESAGNNDMVHVTNDDAGYYDLELTAAQTNYLGRASLAITDAATHCPVFHEFMILPAMIYDALILGTDVLQADVTQLLGTALLTPAVAGTMDVNAKQIGGTAQTGLDLAANWTAARALKVDNLDAQVSSRGTSNYAGGPVASVTAGVTVATNEDKAGYSLSGTLTTLDAIWAKIRKYFQLALRKDAAIATDNADEVTEINANGGSGAGDYLSTSDSQQALRDNYTTGGDTVVLTPIVGRVGESGAVSDSDTVYAYHYAPTVAGPFYAEQANGEPYDLSAYDGQLAFVVFQTAQDNSEGNVAAISGADVTISGADNDTISITNTSGLNQIVGQFRWVIRSTIEDDERVFLSGKYIVRPCARVPA